jgi:hypothetical protein
MVDVAPAQLVFISIFACVIGVALCLTPLSLTFLPGMCSNSGLKKSMIKQDYALRQRLTNQTSYGYCYKVALMISLPEF